MRTKIIEATQSLEHGPNHGKFLVAEFTEEWDVQSLIASRTVLDHCGWGDDHRLVIDLQTGEGAVFRPGGYAKADLDKHKVWVCPMFEPFLEWLYTQPLPLEVDDLPDVVELPDAPAALRGYRRPGPESE